MQPEVLTLSNVLGSPDFHPVAKLEQRIEAVLFKHLAQRGSLAYPINTSDLTTLIERHAEELDLYADLSYYGDVEGATFFQPNKKPVVKISSALSEASNENRLRSTLAHEFGHVLLHDPMYQRARQQGSFERQGEVLQVSFRDGFNSSGDLFEYQAWLVCGALLMPKTELCRVVGGMAMAAGEYGDIQVQSELGIRILSFVTTHFGVSRDLARVRLLRSSVMTENSPRPSLF